MCPIADIEMCACGGGEGGTVQLFTALKDNTSVTSIDLSDNVITDEGMQFMTGVLAGGIAPNLIHVNVRGNPVSERGKELLSGLFHLRKQLKVIAHNKLEESTWGFVLSFSIYTIETSGCICIHM